MHYHKVFSLFINTFSAFGGKINKPFYLEDTSNLIREFLNENFNKNFFFSPKGAEKQKCQCYNFSPLNLANIISTV